MFNIHHNFCKQARDWNEVRKAGVLPAVPAIDKDQSAVKESWDESSIYEKIPE